jgi:hypothetical protein
LAQNLTPFGQLHASFSVPSDYIFAFSSKPRRGRFLSENKMCASALQTAALNAPKFFVFDILNEQCPAWRGRPARAQKIAAMHHQDAKNIKKKVHPNLDGLW